jgi:hypothetical protein
MNFNDDYNHIFKDQSNIFLSLSDLNSTLVLTNSISRELVSIPNINIENISNKDFVIEEMDENYPETSSSNISNPVIEEFEDEIVENASIENVIDENLESKDTKNKYSDIFFNIDIGEKCHSCSLDSYTLIQKDEQMFHKFLNTSHIFQQSLFNFMKNLIMNQ